MSKPKMPFVADQASTRLLNSQPRAFAQTSKRDARSSCSSRSVPRRSCVDVGETPLPQRNAENLLDGALDDLDLLRAEIGPVARSHHEFEQVFEKVAVLRRSRQLQRVEARRRSGRSGPRSFPPIARMSGSAPRSLSKNATRGLGRDAHRLRQQEAEGHRLAGARSAPSP